VSAARPGVRTFDTSDQPDATQPADMQPGDRWRRHDGDFGMLPGGTLAPARRLDASLGRGSISDCYFIEGYPNPDTIQWSGTAEPRR